MDDNNIPRRSVTDPKIFVIEIGTDGFNAYTYEGVLEERGLTTFAASSAMSTFLKVMERIVNSNGSGPTHFQMTEEKT